MTESQIPPNSNPNTGKTMTIRAKSIPGHIVLLVMGAIAILIALIYTVFLPKAFWQSRELEQNRIKWQDQNITHYRMSLTLPFTGSNYDQMPLTVEVKDDHVISVVDTHGETVSPDDEETAYYYPDGLTIPGLFAYADQTFWESPRTIKVTYDPVFGYPETLSVDPYTEPCCQDFSFEIRNFEVLP
jgi:hypothetical protein